MFLSEIAREMEQGLEKSRSRVVSWVLPHGLSLLLFDVNGKRYLRLMRREVVPSELEERICRQAFRVPEGAECSAGQEGRPAHCFVQFTWKGGEVGQAASGTQDKGA